MVPGLRFSATTSNRGTRRRNSSRPPAVFRSMATLRLPRLLRRKVAPTSRPSGSAMAGCEPRPDSPSGGSTFTTSAPRRASSCVAYGSACICSTASTRTPSSGFPKRAASALAVSPRRMSYIVSIVGDEPYWDPFDVDIDRDPYDIWRRLRDEAPLYRNEKHDFWALSRYADVEAAHRDPTTFSSARATVP